MLADQQFVSRLRGQEEAAVLALVERYHTPIARYLSRLTGDPHLADDLAQETFLAAYVALPRLDDEPNLSAWLFQIATNKARQHRRRQRIIRWVSLGALGDATADDGDRLDQRDLVGRALARLPEDYRAGLVLQVWAGLTCAEIGRVLGRSEPAAKMLLARARRRFREVYEGEDL